MKKLILNAVFSIISICSFAQGRPSTPIFIGGGSVYGGVIYNGDPCTSEFTRNGYCTASTRRVEISKKVGDCDATIVLVMREVKCNGKLVMATLISSGINTPPNDPDCEYSFDSEMKHAKALKDYLRDDLIKAYPGLSSVVLATGSTCQTTISFDTKDFTARGNVAQKCDSVWVPAGSGSFMGGNISWPDHWQYTYCPSENSTNYTVAGGHFEFQVPCKSSKTCCYGEATLDANGKVETFTPSNPAINCPAEAGYVPADVIDYFKDLYNVQNGDETKITNITIGWCRPACEFDLSGDYHMPNKSIANPTANNAVAAPQFEIADIQKANLILKSVPSPVSIQITDVNGKLVYNKPYSSNTVDINDLASGVYFIKANFDQNTSITKKFITK